MAITVVVRGVDIESTTPGTPRDTLKGNVRVTIEGTSTVKPPDVPPSQITVPFQISVPFEHALSLTHAVDKALTDLQSWGIQLSDAALRAVEKHRA
jgi:hypothetical protein